MTFRTIYFQIKHIIIVVVVVVVQQPPLHYFPTLNTQIEI